MTQKKIANVSVFWGGFRKLEKVTIKVGRLDCTQRAQIDGRHDRGESAKSGHWGHIRSIKLYERVAQSKEKGPTRKTATRRAPPETR